MTGDLESSNRVTLLALSRSQLSGIKATHSSVGSGDLWDARRKEHLARLTFLIHWDLRRWARVAGEELLAERSEELLLSCPVARDKSLFLRLTG